MFDKQEIIYCRFEKTIMELVPRDECMYMKIVSNDMEKVNISQFDELNYTTYDCSENFDELDQCIGHKFFYSYYPIDLFCDNCNVDGYLCLAYYDIYLADSEYIEYYEGLFMQNEFQTRQELTDWLIDCEER